MDAFTIFIVINYLIGIYLGYRALMNELDLDGEITVGSILFVFLVVLVFGLLSGVVVIVYLIGKTLSLTVIKRKNNENKTNSN